MMTMVESVCKRCRTAIVDPAERVLKEIGVAVQKSQVLGLGRRDQREILMRLSG